MSWPELAYDQTELARLCAERPVHCTEYHLHNQLYGFSDWLKRYAELDPNAPLPWLMEHAITFDETTPYAADGESALPLALAVNAGQARALAMATRAQVEPIGSAYFYVRAVLEREAGPAPAHTRRGTLVFPDKCTTDHDTEYDRVSFARRLVALPAEYQPVWVSVFWRDYAMGAHQPFIDAGLGVLTSGHPFDPLFLVRQLDSCTRFRYACANDLSTSFCLSVLAGCRYFHMPTGPITIVRPGGRRTYDVEPTLALPGKQACIAASPFPPNGDGAAQRRLAEQYAGAEHVRTPGFFRELVARGHRLLSTPPAQQLDFGARTPPDRRATWLLEGVDVDGWTRQRWGFHLRSERLGAFAELVLSVPPGMTAATLTVRRGRAVREHACGTGSWRLMLVAPKDGPGERIEVEGPPERPLTGELRARSVLLRSVRLRPMELGEHLRGTRDGLVSLAGSGFGA